MPEIESTEKVFDYRELCDRAGNHLKHGLHMFRRRWRDAKGVLRDWVFASRNEDPTEVVANAVVVVARVGNKVVLSHEYRVPLGGVETGLSAAGLIDGDESVLATAVRELHEETGLRATMVYPQLTSPLLVSSAGLTDEAARIVFLDAEGELTDRHCEPGESIVPRLYGHDELSAMLFRQDQMLNAKAWGVLYAWWLAGFVCFAPPGWALAGVPVQWDGDSFTVGKS